MQLFIVSTTFCGLLFLEMILLLGNNCWNSPGVTFWTRPLTLTLPLSHLPQTSTFPSISFYISDFGLMYEPIWSLCMTTATLPRPQGPLRSSCLAHCGEPSLSEKPVVTSFAHHFIPSLLVQHGRRDGSLMILTFFDALMVMPSWLLCIGSRRQICPTLYRLRVLLQPLPLWDFCKLVFLCWRDSHLLHGA